MEIFKEETDEGHELSLRDIQEKLRSALDSDDEVKGDIIREDVHEINDYALSITVNNGAHGKKLYSHQERLFEISELRMLMDAVVSARFLTMKEAKRLIRKIKKLTSHAQAEKLPHEMYLEGTVKSESTYLKYNIDHLHRAVSQQRKILFQYGSYDIEKTFVLHRDGEYYSVKPYALIWNSGFYYLIGEYEKYGQIRHYRVDRMRDATVQEDQPFKRQSFHLADYIYKTFNMYAGSDEQWIELHIHNDLFNVMMDRFGTGVDVRKVDDQSFALKTKAALSDGLIHWLLTWGGDVKVVSPNPLIDRLKEESESLYQIYHP